MNCRVLDLTLASVAENLALDESLLLEAEEGAIGEVLRFWEWPAYAVVLGASGRLHVDVDEAACLLDGVPIHRRASGGGTVLLGRGCLIFSLILDMERDPQLKDIRASYRIIINRMVRALRSIQATTQEGISDMAAGEKKISGSAQQRKGRYLLHHGTILYDFDVSAIGRYIRLPSDQPAYRSGRPHEAFVANLPTDSAELKRLIANEWGHDPIREPLPFERSARLTEEKYRQDMWIRKR